MNIAVLIKQQAHLYIRNPNEYEGVRLFLIEDGYSEADISLSIFDVQTWGLAQIKQQADAIRRLVTGDADPIEVAGWNDVAHRLNRIDQGTASEADQLLINDEAKRRGMGETAEQLLAKQRGKAQAFGAANTLINGETKRAKQAIQNAETVEAIVDLVKAYPEAVQIALHSLKQEQTHAE